jgi:hypothetical protein
VLVMLSLVATESQAYAAIVLQQASSGLIALSWRLHRPVLGSGCGSD